MQVQSKMDSKKLTTKTVHIEEFLQHAITNINIRRNAESFLKPHVIERIIHALLYSINIEPTTVILGSDGSHGSKEAIERIIPVLAGNLVKRIIVDRCMSISAAACLMRERQCHFGLIFTAGHHSPSNSETYLGIKILSPPGNPLPASTVEKANKFVQIMPSYQCCDNLNINISVKGGHEYNISDKYFTVQVVDSLNSYETEIRKMFHFGDIKEYLEFLEKKIIIDCSNGVTGPYVKSIFVEEFRISSNYILNGNSLEDFGGLPADLNATTCGDFLQLIKTNNSKFGAVISPDGCRCMIVGDAGFVVSPSDLLAIIADMSKCIRLFQDTPLNTVFRSICTSQAVDKIAENASLLCFEVLPNWENFGRAMITPETNCTLFGEESFGIGACSATYCSDRDGVWAVLAWLSIMSYTRKSVRQIVEDHWIKYGRNVFGRLDFMELPQASLDAFMAHFRDTYTLRFKKIKTGSFGYFKYLDPFGLDPKLQTNEAKKNNVEITFDVCNYVEPYGFVKKCLLRNDTHQIYEIHIADGARLIIRKSKSILNATTVRFYIDVFVDPNDERILKDRGEILEPFIQAALKITKIQDFFDEKLNPIFV